MKEKMGGNKFRWTPRGQRRKKQWRRSCVSFCNRSNGSMIGQMRLQILSSSCLGSSLTPSGQPLVRLVIYEECHRETPYHGRVFVHVNGPQTRDSSRSYKNLLLFLHLPLPLLFRPAISQAKTKLLMR